MKLKNILLPAILFTFILTAFSPDNAAVDKGFGILRIDKKFSQLKTYLTKTNKETEGDYPSTIWTFDFKKAKMETFMGLKVTGIEVGMNLGESETAEEDVYYFHITLEKPKTEKEVSDFTAKLKTAYGPNQTNLHTSETKPRLIHETWFTHITMLSVVYGINGETGVDMDHYEVNFDQGYGG